MVLLGPYITDNVSALCHLFNTVLTVRIIYLHPLVLKKVIIDIGVQRKLHQEMQRLFTKMTKFERQCCF